ncbi:hypothetical protein LSAT2_028613, partial [Lamellibrachia satsuma]
IRAPIAECLSEIEFGAATDLCHTNLAFSCEIRIRHSPAEMRSFIGSFFRSAISRRARYSCAWSCRLTDISPTGSGREERRRDGTETGITAEGGRCAGCGCRWRSRGG